MNAAGPGAHSDPLGLAERRALARCEREALGRFYDLWFDRLHGYVRRLVRDEHLAEDLTQDIFVHLHRALPSYDPERPLRPWVYTIATNKIRDWWQSRRGRERLREISTDRSGGKSGAEERRLELPDGAHGPAEQAGVAELSLRVQGAIAEMPDGLRETLTLRTYQGLEFAEIGAIIGRSEVAVRKRYSRALGDLRERLAELAPERTPGRTHDPARASEPRPPAESQP